jgi:hypothetical protein
MDRNKISHDPHHRGILSGVSKTISEPMVRSVQTMHISCVKVSTISKWTESSFLLSLVTKEYHRVHPKWFLNLLYIWRKPCTCLAPMLTLSPNRPKQDSIWPKSPRCYIGCVQNDLWAYGTFAQSVHLSCVKISTHLQMDWIEIPLEPRHIGVPSVASKMIYEPMVHMAQTVQLSYIDTKTDSK